MHTGSSILARVRLAPIRVKGNRYSFPGLSRKNLAPFVLRLLRCASRRPALSAYSTDTTRLHGAIGLTQLLLTALQPSLAMPLSSPIEKCAFNHALPCLVHI